MCLFVCVYVFQCVCVGVEQQGAEFIQCEGLKDNLSLWGVIHLCLCVCACVCLCVCVCG
mgnify:CR=1 FL=1